MIALVNTKQFASCSNFVSIAVKCTNDITATHLTKQNITCTYELEQQHHPTTIY